MHFRGLKNLDKPYVYVSSEVVVRLDVTPRSLPSGRLNCVSLKKAKSLAQDDVLFSPR